MIDERFEGGPQDVLSAADLRHQVANALLDRADAIINDSVAIFPFSGPQPLDAEFCSQLGQFLLQLLATAVRDGRLDARSGSVGDLHRLTRERGLPVERLFTFAYLTERTALDELALDERIGATSEWPLAAQMVRRASFDLLAAYTDRIQQEPTVAAITDRLTTLYTRAMMDAVLATELQRAERVGRPIVLVVFDVDRLSEINGQYGYGVGDRVLERMGIQMRKYFRHQDWVFRHSEDSIAVLLSETNPPDAAALAQCALGMVEERLGFRDHRTESRVRVTVSAAVVIAHVAVGEPLEPERLLLEADAALERAKRAGRSSIDRVEVVPSALSLDVAARYLGCSPTTIQKLLAAGTLRAIATEPAVQIDRQSFDDYRRQRNSAPSA